jgi:pimeloyl-ACP methyl ester carboxylesterase
MVFARCQGDRACQKAFPDVKAEFETILAQLERQPVATSVTNQQIGQAVTVTRDLFVNVVHELLMGADTAARLPRLVHRAYALGDLDAVASEYTARILPRNTQAVRLLMGAVIRCGEPWAVNTPSAVRRAGAQSYLGASQAVAAESLAQICRVVPTPAPEARYAPTQRSTVPVLLLSGEEDPQNPPENVAWLQEVYTNSRALFEPYRGHYTVEWPCITSVVGEFIELGTVDGLQAPCLSAVKPFPFDVRP